MAERPPVQARLQVHESTLTLSGEISFQTVKAVLAVGRDAIEALSVTKAVLDLSAVTKADSAGLALVVDWMRTAKQRGSQLQVVGAPPQLADIARVSGLEDYLFGA